MIVAGYLCWECRGYEALDLNDYFVDVTGDNDDQVLQVSFQEARLHLFYVVSLGGFTVVALGDNSSLLWLLSATVVHQKSFE